MLVQTKNTLTSIMKKSLVRKCLFDILFWRCGTPFYHINKQNYLYSVDNNNEEIFIFSHPVKTQFIHSICTTRLQCWSHKSHNRSEEYPNMYHFVTEMSAFLLQNDALCDMGLVHCEKNGLMVVLICPLWHNHPFYLLCYSRHGIVNIDLNCNTS